MNDNINSFQDLIAEEFEAEEIVAEDELAESMELLDIVMTTNDEKLAENTRTPIDSFLEEIDESVNRIILEEKEQNFDDLIELFFSEDSDVFEEAMDFELENLEEMQFNPEDGDTIDDDGDIIDFIEGLPSGIDSYIEEE